LSITARPNQRLTIE